MVQLLQDQPLQLVQGLLFSRIDSGLRQKSAQVQIFDLKPEFIFRSHDPSHILIASRIC